ncbi:type III secretion system protein [Pararobbsia alpina]|uniref:PrgH/EprH family type III secretion apparatus protein n=1 Tax=Pararobbsia alpina TaxID=621374 RepID=UPI0039A4FB52
MHSDIETPPHEYAIKILYGPLSGLEIPLASGRHFFATTRTTPSGEMPFGFPERDGSSGIEDSALACTENTYLIPGPVNLAGKTSGAVPNFAVILGQAEPKNHPTRARSGDGEMNDPSGVTEPGQRIDHTEPAPHAIVEVYFEPLASQTVGGASLQQSVRLEEGALFEYGELRFAWKRNESRWSFADACTVSDSMPRTESPGQPRFASGEVAALHERHPFGHRTPRRDTRRPAGHRSAWGLAVFSLVAAMAALGLFSNVAGTQPTLASVETAMQGAPARATVHVGRDGQPYVLVQSERDATWATQALRRIGSTVTTSVRIERNEVDRIEALLERKGVSFYVVRFDSPKQLSLVLSGDDSTLSPSADKLLRDEVLNSFPYIDEVRIDRYAVASIVAKARAGLDALDIRYRQTRHGGTTTFELDSAMDDARLAALGSFAQAFAHEWGTQGVRFIFEPASDGVPLRTMKIRTRGYVSSGGDAIEFTSPVS